MQTLFQKVAQGLIQPADAADIALSLCYLIEEGKHPDKLDPECILLDDDNRVTLDAGWRPVDCLYAAPDVVLDGAAASKESMWFALGGVLFFMLNGRSYYEFCGLDPFDTALNQPGSALVSDEGYTGLAAECIRDLTAWNPAERSRGIAQLIRIAESIPARMVLRYICGGREVYTEEITLTDPLHGYRSGDVITGTDGGCYTIAPGVHIPFRPGTHTMTVPVTALSGSAAAPWLVMSCPDPADSSRTVYLRLLPLDQRPRDKRIPIPADRQVQYRFHLMHLEESTGTARSDHPLDQMTVPASPGRKQAVMHVRADGTDGTFSVSVCDEQNRPIADTRHFQMN